MTMLLTGNDRQIAENRVQSTEDREENRQKIHSLKRQVSDAHLFTTKIIRQKQGMPTQRIFKVGASGAIRPL